MVTSDLFELLIAVASVQQPKSEVQGTDSAGFVFWLLRECDLVAAPSEVWSRRVLPKKEWPIQQCGGNHDKDGSDTAFSGSWGCTGKTQKVKVT